jgi:5-methylcytosine-specific restriction endonuclease McrA
MRKKPEKHYVINGVEMKRCFKCKRFLPANNDYFWSDKKKWDNLNYYCRECKGSFFITHHVKEGFKVCKKCGRELELTTEYFRRSACIKDGFEGTCKECKGWKFTPTPREGYKYCNKCDMEYPNTSEYFKPDKESRGGLTKTCRKCLKRQNKRYYLDNIDKIREYSLKRFQDPEVKRQHREAMRKWEERHPDKIHSYRHKRRALEKQLPITLTIDDWDRCKDYFDHKCAYCGKNKDLTMDHFIPISKMGELSINNAIPSCKSCNSSKNDKDFFEWYPKYRYYSKKREKALLDYLGYKGEIQQLALI